MPSARPKLLLSWSSGKDSAWTLHQLREAGEYEICGLVTTFNAQAERVAMHAVRRDLVRAQAAAAGLPLIEIDLPWPCSNDVYEKTVLEALQPVVAEQDITHMAFGDLFLEDIRAYREKQVADLGITPLFPLWQIPTPELAAQMHAGGLKALLTCVDPAQLPGEFAGRRFDRELLNALPEGVDPCGENGEFHSFVYAGPMFSKPIPVRPGLVVERDGFVFADVTPAPA